MDEFISLLEYKIITLDNYSLTVEQVIRVLGLLIACVFLIKVGSWLVRKKFFLFKKLPRFIIGREKALFIYRTLLYTIATLWSIRILGLKLQEILDFTILRLGNEKSIRLGNIIFGIFLFILTRYLISNFRRLFVEEGKAKRLSMDQGRRMAVYQIFQYLAYLLAVIILIASLDVDLKAILVGSAALFVGLGLALQNTFADILGGILILFDGTIEVGDWLLINGRDIEGEVKEIRLRTTIIETLDSTSIIVPNRMFSDSDVLNWSYNDRETRFSIKVGVAYGSNLQVVRKALRTCAGNHGRVLKNPEPRVFFTDFGNSSLDFQLVYWLSNFRDHQLVESDIRFMIDSEFRKNNISIPFPQRDLHLIPPKKNVVAKVLEKEEKEQNEQKGQVAK